MRLALAVFCAATALFGQDAQPKLGKIEGKVVHSVTGVAVPRVSLTLMPIGQPTTGGSVTVSTGSSTGISTGPPQPAGSASSGADGSFTFTQIPVGNYMLRAERNGFLATGYGSTSQSSPPTLLRVAEGQEITGLTFKLAPQSVVVVKVLDENGEPVNRSMVQVLRSRFAGAQRMTLPMSSGQTNDLGEYRASVGAGSYYVTATLVSSMGPVAMPARQPGQTNDEIPVTTYYPGAIDRTNASMVTLGVGQEMPIIINLQKGHTFRVRGSAPADLARSQLMLMPVSRESLIFTMRGGAAVRPDGSFEFSGVAPGSYTVLASRPGNNPMSSPAARAMVEVVNRDIDGVTLTAVEAVTLKGRIIIEGNTDTDKLDPAGLRVMPAALDGISNFIGINPSTVAADGSFSIEGVSQGRYQLRVLGNLQGAYLKSIRLGQVDVTKTGLDLNGVASPPPIEMVYSRKPASVDVTVIRASPERSPGTVLLVPDSAPATAVLGDLGYIPVQVNQSGTASNKALAPGKYRVYALESFDQLEGIDPDILKRLESRAERITVGEGETATVSVKQLLPADLETRQ